MPEMAGNGKSSVAILKEFPKRDHLVQKLVERMANILKEGVRGRGRASLALSGGKTPKDFFEALSQEELPWSSTLITLVDERWVEPTSKDSNERLVREFLLKNRAKTARFLGLKAPFERARDAEGYVSALIRDNVPLPFDGVVLGMGEDGHTASIFPGAARLKEAVDPEYPLHCIAIQPLDAPHERMTLALNTILNSREIFIHIQGEKKREVLERAMAQGPMEEMPIRYVLHQDKVPVEIYWAP